MPPMRFKRDIAEPLLLYLAFCQETTKQPAILWGLRRWLIAGFGGRASAAIGQQIRQREDILRCLMIALLDHQRHALQALRDLRGAERALRQHHEPHPVPEVAAERVLERARAAGKVIAAD